MNGREAEAKQAETLLSGSFARIGAVGLRVVFGGIFVLGGLIALTMPFEEFVAEIREYRFFPSALEVPAAVAIPWVVLLSGALLARGILVRVALAVIILLVVGFMAAAGWVMLRGIPLGECGCFAGYGLPSATPPMFFLRNLVFLGLALFLWRAEGRLRQPPE